jgi:hypothetical protein
MSEFDLPGATWLDISDGVPQFAQAAPKPMTISER